jgi:hypothetical protein
MRILDNFKRKIKWKGEKKSNEAISGEGLKSLAPFMKNIMHEIGSTLQN